MKQENGAVTRIAGLEEEFRRVRKESLVRREAELERMLKESMLGFDSEEEAEKYALEEQDKEMELLERCGLDEDKIKALDEEDEKYADRYLEVARPKLMASMSDPDDRHRRRIAQIDRMSRFGRIQPACVGGDVLASDKDTLERFAKRGKLGNPSVWFNDPNELRTFEVSQSGGWSTNACGAFGVQFGHYFAVEWWYIWTTLPHSSGMTSNLVLAQLDLTGFYLYAHGTAGTTVNTQKPG